MRGSLAPDKLDDLVILSENPLTIPPEELGNLELLLTKVSGKADWYRTDYEGLCPDQP